MPSSPSSWRRVLLMPLVVLVAAAAMHLWSVHREEQRVTAMEALVGEAWSHAVEGQLATVSLPTIDALLDVPLIGALRSAVSAAGAEGRDPADADIVVGVGHGAGSPASPASHHAVIFVEGRPRLGLQLLESDGHIVVTGFWEPEEMSATPPATDPGPG